MFDPPPLEDVWRIQLAYWTQVLVDDAIRPEPIIEAAIRRMRAGIGGRSLCQFLQNQAGGGQVGSAAAIFLRNEQPEKALLRHLLRQFGRRALFPVDLRGQRFDLLSRESLRASLNAA